MRRPRPANRATQASPLQVHAQLSLRRTFARWLRFAQPTSARSRSPRWVRFVKEHRECSAVGEQRDRRAVRPYSARVLRQESARRATIFAHLDRKHISAEKLL